MAQGAASKASSPTTHGLGNPSAGDQSSHPAARASRSSLRTCAPHSPSMPVIMSSIPPGHAAGPSRSGSRPDAARACAHAHASAHCVDHAR